MTNSINHEFIAQLQANPLATVSDYYAGCLAGHPKAIEYLRRNALFIPAELSLKVGVANRTFGKLIPLKSIALGKQIRSELTSLGIYRSNGREHFRGMVTIPLHSTSGQVTGIYGRRVDMSNGGDVEQHIGSGIFNAQALMQVDEIILSESLLDAWTIYAAGHAHVICAMDHALTSDELASVKRVLLASPTIDCPLLANCELHRIQFPLGHTANSYAIAYRHEVDPLAKLIRSAPYIDTVAGALRDPHANPTLQSSVKVDIPDNLETTQQHAEVDPQVNLPVELVTTRGPGLGEPGRQSTEVENANAKTASLGEPERQTVQASPVPAIVDEFDVQSTDSETTITIETRRWRIRGLDRNTASGVMKVNLMLFNERTDRFHVDTFDLYHARSRRTFLAEAAEEIGAAEPQLRSDLGKVLLKLEQFQHEQTQQSKTPAASAKRLTEEERASALELLRDEYLLDRILEDFETCGIVGERTGKLVGYLAATSRLLPKPLGLIIQSSSAAGKSSLMNAILAFMPIEHQFGCSAMTGQSLYYAANVDLRHKILSIAEEEGVRNASYALKLLQSEGHLSIVTTAKERGTGRTAVERHEVEGPVALMLTTTASDVDEELMNRCLVISVDENQEQTLAIHVRQRGAQTLEEFLHAEVAKRRRELHRNAQRLLRPLRVVNRYADQLKFPAHRTRDRRDNNAYLSLIQSIALLQQHQRTIHQAKLAAKYIEFIEVLPGDIAVANTLISAILGASIDDLPTQSRRLLMKLFDYVRDQAHALHDEPERIVFTRRQLRQVLGLGHTQLVKHLERLVQYEYVLKHTGAGRAARYSLSWDGRGREGELILSGLTDPHKLSEPASMTSVLSALEAQLSVSDGSLPPQNPPTVGPDSAA